MKTLIVRAKEINVVMEEILHDSAFCRSLEYLLSKVYKNRLFDKTNYGYDDTWNENIDPEYN